jgi:F-type H+-transporting ATPase subunit alpha
MKKVAGSLRLDLAQYRELEAFTKFGSELDKSTQNQLNRGQRLIEVLKQPQYSPLSAAEQVIIISVAGQGLIDDVPVERVQAFEKGFMEFVSQHYDHIRRTLLETRELTSDLSATIKEACAEYKKTFLAVEEA